MDGFDGELLAAAKPLPLHRSPSLLSPALADEQKMGDRLELDGHSAGFRPQRSAREEFRG